ncbi:MAG TPA: hypothetical protein VH414_01970 [Lichenihabitans sp.]|jgi:hypothetical protein|nr:hypothetical protein [Lichenihabitans sp.]
MIAIPTHPATTRARPGALFAAAVPVLTAVCLVLAAAMVADTVATIVRLHSALPYFDEWDELDLLKYALHGDTSWFGTLVTQHNEHRIVFPRLVFYADDFLFGGRGILDRIAILAIQVGQAAMLVGLLRRALPRPVLLRRDHTFLALASVSVMLLSCLRQEENFSWGFQVQFVGIFALGTLAFILFAAALERMRDGGSSLGWLLAAYAAAFVATFTMANGLLCAVVLVVLAVLWRAPLRVVLASLGVTALLAAAYLHGYEPQTAHTSLGFSLRHPLRVLSYAAAYLGNFLDPDIAWARLLGLVGLAGTALAVARTYVCRDSTPARLALVGVMLFTAGTAALTALGRLGFGLDQAMSSRYSTGSAAFWSALLIYAWSVSAEWRRPAILRGLIAVTALVLVAGAVRSQGAMKNGMEQRAYSEAMTRDALLLGLHDKDTFGNVDDTTDVIVRLSALLKERGWSVFGEPDAGLVGRPLTEAGPLGDAAACRGTLAAAVSVPAFGHEGVSVVGQAWGLHHNRLNGRTYVADDRNTIVGFGSREPPGDDPSTWTGYAVAAPGATLRAFAQFSNGLLCPLGERTVDPAAAASH